MHSSHGRHRRKRDGPGEDEEAPLLISRADDGRPNAYTRSHHYTQHADSYRPSPSTYDLPREASSSRRRRDADDWRTHESSHSSHDRHSYSSSKDVYHRSGRDDYDMTELRDDGWGSRASSDGYLTTSGREWTHRTSNYDQWPTDDGRHSIEDRAHPRSALDGHTERDANWHKDNRKSREHHFSADHNWESRHDSKKSWVDRRGQKVDESHQSSNDRSWEPSANWKTPARAEDHEARNQNRSAKTIYSPRTKLKKNNYHSGKHSKRDWRTDDPGPNNWRRRDSGNSPRNSRPVNKRKQHRTSSRSRSPAESLHSRHSSRGRPRSRSCSASLKRRRRGSAASNEQGPSLKGRGDCDRKYSKSPTSSTHSAEGRGPRRRSPSSASSSSGSRSRSSSRSPVARPRAIHRLPTTTSVKDITLSATTKTQSRVSNLSSVPRDPVVHGHRNGKFQSNGKRPSSISSVTKTVSTEAMPPPTIIPLGRMSTSLALTNASQDNRVDINVAKTPQTRTKGFKPIGQTSSAVKRFFPNDDDDECPEDLPVQPASQPAARVVSTLSQDPSDEGANQHDKQHDKHFKEHSGDITPQSDSPRQKEPPVERENYENLDPRRLKTSPPKYSPSGPVIQESMTLPEVVVRNEGYPELEATRTEPSTAGGTPTKAPRRELYKIVNQVGEGTFGKVYKAQNTVTGVFVALKRIRMEAERDGFPVTAMREIKLLQSLRHQNVVRLYEMMVSNVNVYMVFEYMDHDLTGILSQTQFMFTDAHLKSLCLQMLAGLAYLHHKGVIHRDIKGSNILINNRGELKLADFGLARFYQKRRRSDYTNRVITLWYRPPELLFGATVYGPEVDMWSAGCIMLELFTKKPIFQGNDEIHQLDVIYKILGTPTAGRWPGVLELPWYELVKPKEFIPNRFRELFQKWLSPAALDLAEQLLSFDPKRRVTAVQAMGASYFQTEEPPSALPVGLATLEGEWHELETKRERAKKRRKMEVVPQ